VSAGSYRPRSATELVDGTIQLYRGNFLMFLTLGAVLYVPLLVVQWTAIGATNPSALAVFAGLAFFLVWGAGWYGVITVVVSDLYTTGTADIASAIQRTQGRIGPVLGASAIGIVGAFVGFLLLVIPGIYALLCWFAIPAVAVLEPLTPLTALARSTALSKGLKGHIGTCLFLLGLLTGAINLLVTFFAAALVGLLSKGAMAGALTVAQFVSGVVTVCLGTLPPIMATLLYYDARIRNEGFDIDLMARSVGGAPAPTPVS